MIRFTELHVALVARAVLQPGEQLFARAAVDEQAWWTFLVPQRRYLLLATGRRIVLVEHRRGFLLAEPRIENVLVVPWSNVETLKLCELAFSRRKLILNALTEATMIGGFATRASGFLRGTFDVREFLGPIKDNMSGLRSIARYWGELGRKTPPALSPEDWPAFIPLYSAASPMPARQNRREQAGLADRPDTQRQGTSPRQGRNGGNGPSG